MPATSRSAHIAPLSAAQVQDLSATALIVALYASDYMPITRPDLDRVAAFIVDGANRLGLRQIIERTARLVAFWDSCEADTATRTDWAAHREEFTHARLVHCSYIVQRYARRIRQALNMMAAEAVAA